MKRRVDLYGECNQEGAPVDHFTAECCMRCINPECTRSTYGQSKFDIRVNTWHDRLFANPSTMSPDDPRFSLISAQKFLAINQPLTVHSGWVDPRDLEKAAAIPTEVAKVVEPAVTQEPVKSGTVAEPPTLPSVALPSVALPPIPTPEPKRPPSPNLAFTNTQTKSGQMLKGAPSPSTPSWDAPSIGTSETEGVRVVKPGTKIRIG